MSTETAQGASELLRVEDLRLPDVTDALLFGLSIALTVAGLRFSIEAREPERSRSSRDHRKRCSPAGAHDGTARVDVGERRTELHRKARKPVVGHEQVRTSADDEHRKCSDGCRMHDGAQVEHWLYPERGLAIALDAKGRELLQYVAPAEFERRLRAPLLKASPAAGPPG